MQWEKYEKAKYSCGWEHTFDFIIQYTISAFTVLKVDFRQPRQPKTIFEYHCISPVNITESLQEYIDEFEMNNR